MASYQPFFENDTWKNRDSARKKSRGPSDAMEVLCAVESEHFGATNEFFDMDTSSDVVSDEKVDQMAGTSHLYGICPSCFAETDERLVECGMQHHAWGCVKCMIQMTCSICQAKSLPFCEFCRRSEKIGSKDLVRHREKSGEEFDKLETSLEEDDAFLVLRRHTNKSNLVFQKCELCKSDVCSSCSYTCAGDHSTFTNETHVICSMCSTSKPSWRQCNMCSSTREECGFCAKNGKKYRVTCDICVKDVCEECVKKNDGKFSSTCAPCGKNMCGQCTKFECKPKSGDPHAVCVFCPYEPLDRITCFACRTSDEICTLCEKNPHAFVIRCGCGATECMSCEEMSFQTFMTARCMLCSEHVSGCIHDITNYGPFQCKGCAACHWLCETCMSTSRGRFIKSCVGCEPRGFKEKLISLKINDKKLPMDVVDVLYSYIFVTQRSPMTPRSKLYYNYK